MIYQLDQRWAPYIAAQQSMYPPSMREGRETFERLLVGPLCWGYFASGVPPEQVIAGNDLIGWVLFEDESTDAEDEPVHGARRQAYCYDLAVLPQEQKRGVGHKLWQHACEQLRWLGYSIRAHTRWQSYRMLSLNSPGYRLVQDRFIKWHFDVEYGDPTLKEHSHEILLRPVGA